MTLLSPNHNHAADECIAQIPQHHIPTPDEKVRASERFDKSVLVAAHMAALHDAYIMEMATHPVSEVVIKPSSPTSSIGSLKPSTLKQLKVGKVHRRRVLSGTLCTKTLCTKGHIGFMVVNVLEDEEGNATPIYLSNAMESNWGSMQAQQMYPEYSKVAVKEPYLTRLPDGVVVLLVEKTTDLVFLWVPEVLKDNGNHETGTDVFTAEKSEEAAVDDRDFGGGAKAVDNEKGSDKLGENGVAEDDVKSSKASRELKFEDVINTKGQEGSVEIASDTKVQGDAKEISTGGSVIDEDDIGKNLVDVKEEEAKEGEVETAEAESIDKSAEDMNEEETKEGEVEAPAAANGNNSGRDLVDVKEGECMEPQVEAEEKGKEGQAKVEEETTEGEVEAPAAADGNNSGRDLVDVKEEECQEAHVEAEEEGKEGQVKAEEETKEEEAPAAADGNNNGRDPIDVKEEECKEVQVEAVEEAKIGQVKAEAETKEGEAEIPAAADGKNIGMDPMDVKEEECKEGQVEAEEEGEDGKVQAAEAAESNASRELSLEDLMDTRRKGEQEGGDTMKEHGGEETDVRDVGEEPLNGDLNQGKVGAPRVDPDTGETATSLRIKGNTLFARGNFNQAGAVYTRAAEKARADGLKVEEVLCLSNRAEVWIRLCRNQAAFDDAEAALKLLRESDGMDAGVHTLPKALFRKGRALMGLHKYEDAMRVLQEVLAKAPADRQLREAAMKCRDRVQQVLKPGKRQRAAAKRRKSGSFAMQ